ncbi:hypothetical protein ACJMK2_004824 [Sinanodonta woodiana]|uniref:Major facilitator superfamily (MFS) profile domain-containing protein n=1 Tax=Sinanodonta woodiana TaxID=1069815 RepID=A0ABD3VN66_SINWO
MTSMHDADKGWSWIVLFASFGSFVINGSLLYGIGIVNVALLEQYEEPLGTTAWAAAAFAALTSIAGPLSSYIIDKFSCRVAIMTCGLLTSVGCLSTSFAPSIHWCVVTYGIIAGTGSGIGYTAAMVVIGFNFRKFRKLAMSIAVAGVGIGVFVFSPVLQIVRDYYGNRGFFIILAGLALHQFVFGALCKPSSLEMERHINKRAATSDKVSFSWSSMRRNCDVYMHKPILCFSLSMLMYGVGTYMIFIHLPNYSIQKGYTAFQASWLISVCGLFTVVSRILTIIASNNDNIDDIILYSGLFGSLALGTFLFPLYSGAFAGQVVFSIMLGTYFGGCYAIMNSISMRLVGLKHLAAATGMELFCCSLGTVIGPVVSGAIVDHGGTYEQAFMIAAFCILIGAALGMATVLFYASNSSHYGSEIDIVIDRVGRKCEAESIFSIKAREEKCKKSKWNLTNLANHKSESMLSLSVENPKMWTINVDDEIHKLLRGEEIQYIDDSS